MINLKKILVVLAVLTALACMTLSFASCGGDESGESEVTTTAVCSEHTDADADGACDKCGAAVEKPCVHTDADYNSLCDNCGSEYTVSVDYTVTMNDEAGNGVSGVTFTIYKNGETVASLVTDANGNATGTINAGIYQINAEGLPVFWNSNASYVDIEINETNKAFVYTAVDNTPDGTEENPFPAENAETGEGTTVKMPADASYIFTAKGSSRYLVIENADVKVKYNDTEYLPENGVVRIFMEAASDTNTATFFTVINTSSKETTVSVKFEALPGSADNPYGVILGEATTASVPEGGTIYYTFTATATGILMVRSETSVNNIMMYNTTSYVVTSYTNGSLCNYIYVTKGDVVSVTVALTDKAPASDVVFTLSYHAGTAEDPIPVYESASLRMLAGAVYTLKYSGENKSMSLSAGGVTVTLNGTAQTAANGKYTFDVKEGDVITVTNTSADRADVAFSIS